jgi:hypothetical protein
MRYSIGSKTNSVASGGLQNMWNPKAIAGSLLAGSISLLTGLKQKKKVKHIIMLY